MIRDKLQKDSFEALKARDNRLVDVLRFLKSLIDKKEMQLPPGSLTEIEETKILNKELKDKEISKEMFAKAGRNDLVEQLDYEIEIVKRYLPELISEEQVTKMVEEVLQSRTGENINFGMIMKEVMIKTAGAVDGSIISRIVKEKING
jgi:hypothetical protein